LRLIAPLHEGGVAASPRSLVVLANSGCGRELIDRKRVEDVTVCTLKGLSGQYEFHGLLDSVVYLIG
jgi:hypothetical protein